MSMKTHQGGEHHETPPITTRAPPIIIAKRPSIMKSGDHEKAGHHAHVAHAHGLHATHHGHEAAKHHAENHKKRRTTSGPEPQ